MVAFSAAKINRNSTTKKVNGIKQFANGWKKSVRPKHEISFQTTYLLYIIYYTCVCLGDVYFIPLYIYWDQTILIFVVL